MHFNYTPCIEAAEYSKFDGKFFYPKQFIYDSYFAPTNTFELNQFPTSEEFGVLQYPYSSRSFCFDDNLYYTQKPENKFKIDCLCNKESSLVSTVCEQNAKYLAKYAGIYDPQYCFDSFNLDNNFITVNFDSDSCPNDSYMRCKNINDLSNIVRNVRYNYYYNTDENHNANALKSEYRTFPQLMDLSSWHNMSFENKQNLGCIENEQFSSSSGIFNIYNSVFKSLGIFSNIINGIVMFPLQMTFFSFFSSISILASGMGYSIFSNNPFSVFNNYFFEQLVIIFQDFKLIFHTIFSNLFGWPYMLIIDFCSYMLSLIPFILNFSLTFLSLGCMQLIFSFPFKVLSKLIYLFSFIFKFSFIDNLYYFTQNILQILTKVLLSSFITNAFIVQTLFSIGFLFSVAFYSCFFDLLFFNNKITKKIISSTILMFSLSDLFFFVFS